MMGTKTRSFSPVPAVSVEALVPADHFYRHVEQVPDLSFLRELVQDCSAAGVGRPTIDPVVFFKLQLDSVGKVTQAAAKRDGRERVGRVPLSHEQRRPLLSAVAVATCCTCVRARPR
jgi:hypothetical protein